MLARAAMVGVTRFALEVARHPYFGLVATIARADGKESARFLVEGGVVIGVSDELLAFDPYDLVPEVRPPAAGELPKPEGVT